MDVLTELVAKISTDATELKKGLSDAEGATEQSSQKMGESLKKVGMAMAASGAAITAAMGMMGKAAIDEEINIKRLSGTMKTVGVNYDSVKDSLEAVIATTQRKTGIADNEQREILSRLILATGDYEKSLELLPTALDLMAEGEMNGVTAATYLAKAYLDLENGAESVGIRFGTATLQFKNMEEIQRKVKGRAEDLANPLSVLKASIGDVAEVIGSNLVPMIKGAIDKIVDIAIKVQDWAKEHPELAKTLTIVATALGVVLTVVGGLILILPGLIAGVAAFGVVFHAALGPIGLISLAIAGLITVGILLWQNWDKVKDFFEGLWINMKIIFAEGVKFIVNTVLLPFIEFWGKYIGIIITGAGKIAGVFNKELGESIENVGNKFFNARQELNAWADDLAEGARVEKSIRETEKALNDVSEALIETTEVVVQNTDATIEQTKAAEENIAILKEQQDELTTLTEQLRKTRREYEYSRSDAGRLGISIKDVTYALFDMGKTTDEIASKMALLGDDASDVNKVMEAFNLTAQQVAASLDAQKGSIDSLTSAYRNLGKAPSQPGGGAVGGEQLVYGSAAERLAGEHGMSLEAAQDTIQRYSENPKSEEFAPVLGIMQSIVGYKKGGLVADTGLAYLHEGETVVPSNESMGGVTVNISGPLFMEREDQMNQLVDKIRKGIQRSDRLRFGGAYSG